MDIIQSLSNFEGLFENLELLALKSRNVQRVFNNVLQMDGTIVSDLYIFEYSDYVWSLIPQHPNNYL